MKFFSFVEKSPNQLKLRISQQLQLSTLKVNLKTKPSQITYVILGGKFSKFDLKGYSDEYLQIGKPFQKRDKKSTIFKIIYLDEYLKKNSLHKLIEEIINQYPKAVLITHAPSKIIRNERFSYYQIWNLKKHIPKTKICLIAFDTVSGKFWRLVRAKKLIDLVFTMDNPKFIFKKRSEPKSIYCPSFNCNLQTENPVNHKEIDIWFCGQTNSYRLNRVSYIKELQKITGNLFLINSEAIPVSQKEYYHTMAKSKIVVNFSESFHGHQVKGRFWDALLSGAMVLEQKNPQLSEIFKSGIDFVEFESESDLLMKANHYLKFPNQRIKIAKTGQLRAKKFIAQNNLLKCLEIEMNVQ